MFRFIRIHETYRIHGFTKINELQRFIIRSNRTDIDRMHRVTRINRTHRFARITVYTLDFTSLPGTLETGLQATLDFTGLLGTSKTVPKLSVVNAAKCFSQTWKYLDKRTINESAVIKILELLFSARTPC